MKNRRKVSRILGISEAKRRHSRPRDSQGAHAGAPGGKMRTSLRRIQRAYFFRNRRAGSRATLVAVRCRRRVHAQLHPCLASTDAWPHLHQGCRSLGLAYTKDAGDPCLASTASDPSPLLSTPSRAPGGRRAAAVARRTVARTLYKQSCVPKIPRFTPVLPVCVDCLFLRSPSRVPYRTELIPRAPKGRRTRTPHP